MKLSKKSDYALRALVELALRHGKGPVSIRALAQNNDVPQGFLQQIMLELKEQGWVTSLPGRDGGYLLALEPEQITMGQVVRHIDGVLAPVGCVSITHYEACTQEAACRFRRVLLEVRNFTARLMDQTSLAALAAGAPATNEEVFSQEFIGGAGI